MERVTHTCGQQLWRQQFGGVAYTIHYADDDQKEIHDCPRCGKNLRDTDLTDERGQLIRAERDN